MAQKIGIIGSGMVGVALAKGFLNYGHPVMIASRSEEKREELKSKIGGEVQTGSFSEAAAFADTVVIAVKGHAVLDALGECGVNNLNGKTVIDANNPIAEAPPENGVLKYFTDPNHSLMEQLQQAYPEAHFVKAFSSVGAMHMVDPQFDSKPTMFICGNNSEAKAEVSQILDTFGWEVADMGAVTAARAIEPLAQLWCIPLFSGSKGDYAFKLLRKS